MFFFGVLFFGLQHIVSPQRYARRERAVRGTETTTEGTLAQVSSGLMPTHPSPPAAIPHSTAHLKFVKTSTGRVRSGPSETGPLPRRENQAADRCSESVVGKKTVQEMLLCGERCARAYSCSVGCQQRDPRHHDGLHDR
jgi:hypothetical protein